MTKICDNFDYDKICFLQTLEHARHLRDERGLQAGKKVNIVAVEDGEEDKMTDDEKKVCPVVSMVTLSLRLLIHRPPCNLCKIGFVRFLHLLSKLISKSWYWYLYSYSTNGKGGSHLLSNGKAWHTVL